jgi:hypothetical protein
MTALLADPSLPGIIHKLSNPTCRALGTLGEQFAHRILEKRYHVSNTHPKERRGDLRVVTDDGLILRVEVKTARMASDGCWRFTLHKKGHTDHRDSDVILALCVMPAGYVVPFVVPTPVVAEQNALVIASDPNIYAGKYARYRQNVRTINLEPLS